MIEQTAAEKDGDIIQGRGGNIAGQLPRLPDDSRASARILRARILRRPRRLRSSRVTLLHVYLSLYLSIHLSLSVSLILALFRLLLLSDLLRSYFTRDIYRTFLIRAATRPSRRQSSYKQAGT